MVLENVIAADTGHRKLFEKAMTDRSEASLLFRNMVLQRYLLWEHQQCV